MPTNVPLKPYKPSSISSFEYPEKNAVSVPTKLPNRAKSANSHELQAIPTNINKPETALFWNMTCPTPLPIINNPSRILLVFINEKPSPPFGREGLSCLTFKDYVISLIFREKLHPKDIHRRKYRTQCKRQRRLHTFHLQKLRLPDTRRCKYRKLHNHHQLRKPYQLEFKLLMPCFIQTIPQS